MYGIFILRWVPLEFKIVRLFLAHSAVYRTPELATALFNMAIHGFLGVFFFFLNPTPSLRLSPSQRRSPRVRAAIMLATLLFSCTDRKRGAGKPREVG